MKIFQTVVKDISHTAFWYLLLFAILLFSGGETLNFIYMSF